MELSPPSLYRKEQLPGCWTNSIEFLHLSRFTQWIRYINRFWTRTPIGIPRAITSFVGTMHDLSTIAPTQIALRQPMNLRLPFATFTLGNSSQMTMGI